MAEKPALERVQEYFGGRWTVLLTGILCWVYFVIQFAPETPYIANILPPMPLWYFVALIVPIMTYQVITWHSFRLLRGFWFVNPVILFMFFCELGTLLFASALLSWPIYFIYIFILYLMKLN